MNCGGKWGLSLISDEKGLACSSWKKSLECVADEIMMLLRQKKAWSGVCFRPWFWDECAEGPTGAATYPAALREAEKGAPRWTQPQAPEQGGSRGEIQRGERHTGRRHVSGMICGQQSRYLEWKVEAHRLLVLIPHLGEKSWHFPIIFQPRRLFVTFSNYLPFRNFNHEPLAILIFFAQWQVIDIHATTCNHLHDPVIKYLGTSGNAAERGHGTDDGNRVVIVERSDKEIQRRNFQPRDDLSAAEDWSSAGERGAG